MTTIMSYVHDLTHLVGPLTEESLVKCLQSRFNNRLPQTLIGPQLVCVNGFLHSPGLNVLYPEKDHTYTTRAQLTSSLRQTTGEKIGNGSPHLLLPTEGLAEDNRSLSGFMENMIKTVLSQHADSFHPQVILVSGENGSGKTECSMQVLRQLLDIAGGGNQTDAFKYLSAALTVIRSLTSAATMANPHSSRIGMYIENLTSDGLVYRTKIHCLLVDMGRVCHVPRREKNYHIFYQMLFGLSPDEKVKLHLNGFTARTLRYLCDGTLCEEKPDDKVRFEAWKASLSVLGIPVSDVLRVLASVLLLGNVQFVEGVGQELDVLGNNELKSVAALLGVSGVALYRGFTTHTRVSHGQVCRTITDAASANHSRDSLSRALYFRTLSAILQRINSMKRRSSHCTQSTESLESKGSSQYNSKPDIMSPPLPSFLGLSLSKKSSESFIGILDLFGFETAEVNSLEQLCINLCAEAMQHYYNTHVFRSPADALYDEGIQPEADVNYFNNTPVIELLSAQATGLLSILDNLSMSDVSSQHIFVEQIRSNHTANNYFFEPLPKNDHLFGIRHFTGRVVYDVSGFLSTNQDQLPEDIIYVFAQQNCNFGFVSHLFASEIKPSPDGVMGPCGRRFRLLSSSQQENESQDSEQGTLSKDFQSRLENILKSVTCAKPHFIRCIKGNDHCQAGVFDPETVTRQVRSLQITEAVQLMAGGLPHRLRYKTFNSQYRLFLTGPRYQRKSDPPFEECKAILSQFLRAMDESRLPYISTQWSLGRRHIFYSEGTRQSLEAMRQERVTSAATTIQAAWRGFKTRKSFNNRAKRKTSDKKKFTTSGLMPPTPRPQLPPKGEKIEKVEPAVLAYVCKMWGTNLQSRPDLPPKRTYSIHGNVKISYPQSRCMNINFPEQSQDEDGFLKGDIVTVLGPSARKGHLMTQKGDIIHHVPYFNMDIQTIHETSTMNI